MWSTWRSWSFNISSRLCFHNSLFLSLSFLGDEEPAIPHHWQAGSSFRIWIGRQNFHQISVSSYSGHQCNGSQRHQVSDMLQWGTPFGSYDWWESEVFGSAAKGNRARINVFDMLCWWCSAWISLNLFETICHGGIAPCHDVSEQNSQAARTPLILPRWFWWSFWRRQRVHDDLAVCSF